MGDNELGLITLEEAIAESKGKAPSLDYIRANFGQIVKEVEAEMGPQVPSLYLHHLPKRGRRKADDECDPVVGKTIKMSVAFWDDFKKVAAKEGVSLHSAIRTALLEYSKRKHTVGINRLPR